MTILTDFDFFDFEKFLEPNGSNFAAESEWNSKISWKRMKIGL